MISENKQTAREKKAAALYKRMEACRGSSKKQTLLAEDLKQYIGSNSQLFLDFCYQIAETDFEICSFSLKSFLWERLSDPLISPYMKCAIFNGLIRSYPIKPKQIEQLDIEPDMKKAFLNLYGDLHT